MGNTLSCVGRSSTGPKKEGDAPSTPHGLPLPPGKPRLREATETSLHIEWDKPTSDGGSQILAYIIKMCRSEGSAWRKLDMDCTDLHYLAKNLESGESYKFFVQCENDNGVSKPSEISDLFQTKTFAVAVSNDVNENVKETFGSSAEKYVKRENDDDDGDDAKSTKSDASDKSNRSEKSGKSDHSKKSDKSQKSEKSDNSKKSEKSEHSKKSEKDEKSDGSEKGEDENQDSKDASRDEIVVDGKTATVATGVSNEKEFAAEADDDVRHGRPLGPSAYTYSNDSLLDDDDDGETRHRYNDLTYQHGSVTVHTSYNSTMEEYHTIDNEIPDEHRDVIMNLGFDLDPEYNRLSIISERSVEESVGTPDPNVSPTKDCHFTFVRKFNEITTNGEECNGTKKDVEEVKTMVSGKEMSTMVVTRSQTESKPMETRIPMMGGKREVYNNSTSSVSKEVTSSVKEVKVATKLPSMSKVPKEETKNEGEKKSSIPQMERKSSIPEMERKSSIPEMERKSSIPKLSSKDKPKVDTPPPSQIPPPRRGSAGKAIPARSDSFEEAKSGKIPRARAESPSNKATSGFPTGGIATPSSGSGIATQSSGSGIAIATSGSGIARRGSKDSAKSNGSPQHFQSRIPGSGNKSGIPAPSPGSGNKSGIPAPKVNVS